MNKRNVLARVEAYNTGRDLERLQLKYKRMQRRAFAFLRGTAHLFYEDWPVDSPLNQAPLAWVCGDLHVENFGTYKGDNRLTYFDLNDFDEGALAPCTWELARFLTSLLVGAETLKIDHAQAVRLCDEFLDTYCAELTECKARWIERATARGMIRELLKGLKKRSRADFLRERITQKDGKTLLRTTGKKALPANAAERKKVTRLIDRFAAGQRNPECFRVLDVARRISGLSSLGLERYVVLAAGQGAREGLYLLDLKYQPGSALSPHLTIPQPKWKSEAERVVTLQRRIQAIAPAFLSTITYGHRSYVLRELMPQQDRLDLGNSNGKLKRLKKVVRAMGELVAWGHVRSAGWQGSAIADQWIAFGRHNKWRQPLLDYAIAYSRQVQSDWRMFMEMM
ncbi:MAG: DUF2252 domain-containing protein [Pseudomonadota bacterium]